MKKFIALLMVGGLLLTGCGQQAPAPEKEEDVAPVVEETPTEEVAEDEDAVSDAAVESTDKSTEEVNTELDEDESDALLNFGKSSEWDSHMDTSHDDKNVDADNSVDYFPEIMNISSLDDSIFFITMGSTEWKDYNYTLQHRTFDGLVSSTEGDVSVTDKNLSIIADILTNEYAEEYVADDEEYHVDTEGFYEDLGCYCVHIVRQPIGAGELPEDFDGDVLEYLEENVNNKLTYDEIIIFRTVDDPNNGVTVLTSIGLKDPAEWPI